MSAAPDPEVVEIAELAEPSGKWRTIVGRIILAVLVVVLIIEAHAKFGYDRTLAALRAKASKIEGEVILGQQALEDWSLPLADAEQCVSGYPSQRRESLLGMNVVVLFKTYVVQLQLDDQNTVMSLTTEDL
jgi:hypothetical protein